MPEDADPRDVLGLDMGIVELATDSTGESFSGSDIESKRRHYAKRRAGLNRVGTKSRPTTALEDGTKGNELPAKYEPLDQQDDRCEGEGIRLRDCHRRPRWDQRSAHGCGKSQRNRLGGWGFAQLGLFLEYSCALAGIPLIQVDPRNTSRTCAECAGIATRATGRLRPISSARIVVTPRTPISTGLGSSGARGASLPEVGVDDAGLEPRSRLLTSRLL